MEFQVIKELPNRPQYEPYYQNGQKAFWYGENIGPKLNSDDLILESVFFIAGYLDAMKEKALQR